MKKYFNHIIITVVTLLITGAGGAVWGGVIEPGIRKQKDTELARRQDMMEVDIARKVDKSVFDITVDNVKEELDEVKKNQAKQTEMLFEIYKEVKK